MRCRTGSCVAVLSVLLLVGGCSPAEDTTPADETTPSASPPSTSPQPASPPTVGPGESADRPPYSASVRRIGPRLRERMRFSHRDGCPVPLSDLRYLRMPYIGFDGDARRGEMVVHVDHAEALVGVFRRLYEARWPIRRMRLVDAYRGDDDRSMAANNTSAYNCRRVAGSDAWSEHAYGAAVDLNPVQNPYVRASTVAPPSGRRFASVDRSRARVPDGVIRADDVVVRAFARIGWEWGGEWSSAKDYQHFSASGR